MCTGGVWVLNESAVLCHVVLQDSYATPRVQVTIGGQIGTSFSVFSSLDAPFVSAVRPSLG